MSQIDRVFQIPIYLKTSPGAPRPRDPQFYWMTRDGVFICRTNEFFESDVLARRMPRWLADHKPACRVAFPRLGAAALEYVVGFFDAVYHRHGAEAIVLLLWDLRKKRYRLCVPPQRASVWKSQSGFPCAIDVTYKVPTPMPADHLLVADVHSHADLSAHPSFTDTNDERYRDGVHVIVGQIDREPPEFHLEMTADGCRFTLQFDHFFKGYRSRRRNVPKAWLDQVTVKVTQSTWTSAYAQCNGRSGHGTNTARFEPKPRTGKRDNWA